MFELLRLARRLPLVGVLFMFSGFAKVLGLVQNADAEPVRENLVAPALFSKRTQAIIGTFELGVAFTDLLMSRRRLAGLVGAGFFATGAVWFGRILQSGREVRCNCFGALSEGPVSGRTIVRNGLLMTMALHQALPNHRTAPEFNLMRSISSARLWVATNVVWLGLVMYLSVLLASTRREVQMHKRPTVVGEYIPHFEVLAANQSPTDLVDHFAARGLDRFLLVAGTPACA